MDRSDMISWTDVHCHLLPGVDDGARTMEETRQMLRSAKAAGAAAIVATPHIYEVHDLNRILNAYEAARKEAEKTGIQLLLGFEVRYRALLAMDAETLVRYCVAGTRRLMLEFSNHHLPPGWEDILCGLVQAGITPVIVHPERYEYIQKKPDLLAEMRAYGCESQIDAAPLAYPFWSREGKTAKLILKKGWADYIASDAHRPNHYEDLLRIRKKWYRQWPSGDEMFRMKADA